MGRLGRMRSTTAYGVLAVALVAGCAAEDGEPGQGGSGASSAAASGDATSTEAAQDGSGAPAAGASLVQIEGWALDDAPPPSLAADAPASVVCEFGWGVEDGVFEVDSELCNWGSFVQPSQVSVRAGDTMEVIILHDALFSEVADVEAHLAVALGETVVWETTLMIPSPAGYLRPEIPVPVDADAGTPVHWHVHNHGYNNYRLVDIVVQGG